MIHLDLDALLKYLKKINSMRNCRKKLNSFASY